MVRELRHDPELAKLIFNISTSMQPNSYATWLNRYVKPLASAAGYRLVTTPEPGGNIVTVGFKASEQLAERLARCAEKKGISKSSLIRLLIESFIDKLCGEGREHEEV